MNTVNEPKSHACLHCPAVAFSSVMLCVTNINFLLGQTFVEAVDTAVHGRIKMFEHLCVCFKIYGSFCSLGQRS